MDTDKGSWPRRLVFRLLPVAALIILSFVTTSVSQWQKSVGPLTGMIPKINSAAIHYKQGHLYAGCSSLYMSRDSGVNWVSLSNLNINGGLITEINFYDSNNGVVAATTGLYRTVDAGTTWNRILTFAPCFAAQYAGSPMNIVAACDNTGFYYSNNGGSTWINFFTSTHATLVQGYPDGSAYGFTGGVGIGNLYKTVDKGVSWQKISVTDYDSWSLARDSDLTTLFLINEEAHVITDNKANIIRTGDAGKTWKKLTSFTPQYYCGSVSIVPCAMYCQEVFGSVLRSTDRGNSWQSIGGPENVVDTRTICAINNDIVFASDTFGNIWATYNSGGVPMSPPKPSFIFESKLAVATITTCQQDSLVVILSGGNLCAPRDVALTEAEWYDGKINSFGISFPQLPDTILFGTFDTLKVAFHQFHEYGTVTARIHVKGFLFDDTSSTPFDTLITVQVTVVPMAPDIKVNTIKLIYPTIANCAELSEGTVTMTNNGCDTLRIIGGPGSIAPGFYVDPILYPIILAPNQQVTIRIYFAPPADGSYSATAIFTGFEQGITKDVAIALSGVSDRGVKNPTIFDTVITLPNSSVCQSSSDTIITVTNLGCDTLILTTPPLIGGGFSFNSSDFPISIAPNASAGIVVHFHSTVLGSYSSIATFYARRKTGSADFKITFKATVSTLKAPPVVLSNIVNFGAVSLCDSSRDTTIYFTNRGCDTLTIFSGPGNLAPQFSISGLTLPYILYPDSSVAVRLHFSSGSIGIYISTANYGAKRSGGTTEDIQFTLNGNNAGATAGPIVIQSFFAFNAVSFCDSSRDTTIVLKNRGCDSLRIESGPAALQAGFSIDPINYPIVLAPDSIYLLKIHFTPSSTGIVTETAQFSTSRSGVTSTLVLDFEANIKPGIGILSITNPNIIFPPLANCLEDSTEIVFTNIGCDSLFVSGLIGGGDNDFSAVSQPEIKVGKNEIVKIKLHLKPQQLGIRIGSYVLHIRNRDGSTYDTTIKISATIIAGSKILSSTDSLIDFGLRGICELADTTILLFNRGCDTLTFFSAEIGGNGFGVDTITPLVLQPGQSTIIRIHSISDTINRKHTMQGSLMVHSSSDLQFDTIFLHRVNQYPKSYSIHLALSKQNAGAGDTLGVDIITDSLPSDATTLTTTLAPANTDLLTYLYSISKNTVTVSGTTVSISGSPITTVSGVVATAYYRMYLTSDSIASIALSGAVFNESDADYSGCVATLSPSNNSDTILYNFECGERLIGSLLREGSIRIKSLAPNPTHNEITIKLDNPKKQEVSIELFDLLGNRCLMQPVEIPSGISNQSVSTIALRSGMYILVIKSAGGYVREQFIKY